MEPNNDMNAPSKTPQPRPAGEGSIGPVVGAIIVLAVIVLGGLYFWGSHSNQPTTNDTVASSTASSTDDMNTVPANTDTGIEYRGS